MLSSNPIVITGAGGFIGSYLVNSLLKNGTQPRNIWACDDLASINKHACCSSWKDSGVQKISPEDLLKRLDQIRPVFILHMGACSRTDEIRWDYLERVNLEYSKSIWTWCTNHQVPLIYASSAATYGDGSLGFDDTLNVELMSELKPLNLYGKSKWLFDLWALEQANKGKMPMGFWGFKFFNVYGPGEDHKGSQASVVFHASKQLLEKGAITLFKSHHPEYADGEQMRDFICVEDLAKVCLWINEARPTSGIYNLGTGKAQTFLDLAHAVLEANHSSAPINFIPTPEHLREHYQYFTEAKMDSLRRAGYTASFMDLHEGVRFTLGNTPNP